jgi:imidazolonepropionase
MAGNSESPALRPSSQSLGIIQGPEICLAADTDRICYVGPETSLGEIVDGSSAEELDAKDSLVLPGFVDAHTHSMFAGSRETELDDKLRGASYLDILRRGGGILKTVRQTRNSTDQEIVDQTVIRLQRMLAGGTTTVEVKSGYGLSLKEELRLLSLLAVIRKRHGFDIVPTLLSAHAVPEEFKGKPEKYIQEVVYPSTDAASEKGLADFFDVFLEEGVFSHDDCSDMLIHARERGFALKIHADEFSDLKGAKLGADLKVASADHLLCASSEGLKALASAGVISVLLPGTSVTSFARRFADARSIIDSGGAVALGTDLSPNSWIESMPLVIWLACYCMKMTPAEAIAAGTINSAHAVGREKDVGSLEVGKKCNLIVTNMKRYEDVPYRFSPNFAECVVKNGSVVKS